LILLNVVLDSVHSRILHRTRTKVSTNSLCTEAGDDLFIWAMKDAMWSLMHHTPCS